MALGLDALELAQVLRRRLRLFGGDAERDVARQRARVERSGGEAAGRDSGIPTWTDPRLVHELISRRRALLRRPVVDVRRLVEERSEQLSPGVA
jgi:hypothetical protein